MDDWEVWDITEEDEETCKNGSDGSSVDEETKGEGKLETSTRVSVRTSFIGDSSTDLTSDDLEEVQITYVFKEKNKSLDNLTKSCDHLTPSRRNKHSFRQSLKERLSLNFNSSNNNNKTEGTQNTVNMLSKSRSLEYVNKTKDDDDDFFMSVRRNKKHFSDTRSDLTSVGLHSDDEVTEHLNVFTDSEDELEGHKLTPQVHSALHSSTPKSKINRSRSFTDFKKLQDSKTGEEICVLTVPSTSLNRTKSLETMITKTPEHQAGDKNNKTDNSHDKDHEQPVVRRPKVRSYSDNFRIDSGYFSPDDTRKDSAGSSSTPYMITFTPEQSLHQNSVTDINGGNSSIVQQGLASMIPIGVSETMMDKTNTENIIHNVQEPHSVEEHGTFNLSVKRESSLQRFSFTEDDEYVDIDFVIDDNENAKEVENNQEVLENQGTGSDVKEENDNDEVDCAKYSYRTSSPLQIRIECPTPERLNESIEEGSGGFNIMHSTSPEDGGFSLMHATCPDDNHEDPSLENIDVDHIGRQRHESGSVFEDSINSFEAHEREYTLASLNGTPTMSFPPEGLSYKEWDDLNEQRKLTLALLEYLPPIMEEGKHSGCEAEVDECEEDQKKVHHDVNQAIKAANKDDEETRTLSAENLRLHDETSGDEETKKAILQDFLNSCSTTHDQDDNDDPESHDSGLDVPDSKSAMVTTTNVVQQDEERPSVKDVVSKEAEKEIIAVEETSVFLDATPPSIVIEPAADDQISFESDDYDETRPSPLAKQNVDFNSRYSLTFSDIDSEGEEQCNIDELPELLPAVEISILNEDVRTAHLVQQLADECSITIQQVIGKIDDEETGTIEETVHEVIDLTTSDGDDGETVNDDGESKGDNDGETVNDDGDGKGEDGGDIEQEAGDTVPELVSNKVKHIPRQDTIEQAIRSNEMRRNTGLRRDPSLAWDDFQASYNEYDYYNNQDDGEYRLDERDEMIDDFEDSDKTKSKDEEEVTSLELQSPRSEEAVEMYESIENASMTSEEQVEVKRTEEPEALTYDIKELEAELPEDDTETVKRILQINKDDDCSHLLKLKIRSASTYARFYSQLSEETTYDGDMAFRLYNIMENEHMNFILVINEILCYLGVIKSESPVPSDVQVDKLLDFLTYFIHRYDISVQHIQTFVYFLIKPSYTLRQYHTQRLRFITTCLHKEMLYTQHSMTTLEKMTAAFKKICKYLVHLDRQQSKSLVKEYIIVNMTTEISYRFINNILTYMGLLKSEETIQKSDNLSAPLFLIDFIIDNCCKEQLSSQTYELLKAFLSEQVAWKYKFCDHQRKKLYTKLTNIDTR